MRFLPLVFLLILGCSQLKKASSNKSAKRADKATLAEDKELKKLIKARFSRKGKYSTVTDGNVTMEKYRRDDGETVLTLENEELRTETLIEKGRTITRTWQNDEVTNLTVIHSQKTTMVSLDRDGKFIHKIITRKGKKKPVCVWYEKEMTIVEEDETCVETLSGFD
jgi:hypothetical protein